MKIHKIVMHQEFNAPIQKVWADMSDHISMGKILGQKFKIIKEGNNPSEPSGVGSVRRIDIPVFGFEETVMKSEKEKLIEYKITKGTPLNHHYGTMIFKSLGDNKSSLDYTIELGSKIPFLGLILKVALTGLIGGGIKKYAKKLK